MWTGLNPPGFFMTAGADLIIPSLFVPHPGELRNIPIMRRATIAAMPQERLRYVPSERPPYLIETRSLGGASGSPVFVNLRPNDPVTPVVPVNPDGSASLPLLLIGMLLSSHQGDYADDFATMDETRSFADAQFNAGVSAVMPVATIFDFLNSDEMVAARAAAISRDKSRVGYRSMTSSRNATSPSPLIAGAVQRRPPASPPTDHEGES
jgi:hypothetical protein